MDSKLSRLLKKIVSISSSYPNEQRLVNFTFELLKKNAYKPARQFVERDRFNVTVEKGTGKKSILLYSHLDTVGVAHGWNTQPLTLSIKGDRAYGLGAWDMKGGITASILTFLNYRPKNFLLKLALCVDEENISKGGYKLAGSSFFDNVSCVISSEPAFQYGLRGIVTGRVGRAVYEIDIDRPSTHFAFYTPQVDTNLLVAEFISRLTDFYKKYANSKQFIFARKIVSETIGMSLPQKVRIELDCAVLPPTSHLEIFNKLNIIGKKINKKYKDFSFRINPVKRDTPFLEPYKINQKNQYLRILKSSVRDVTQKKPVAYFRSSVADENIFGSRGITVLGIGPEGGNAHSANEWVSLTSVEKLYQILNNFLAKVDRNI